MIFATPNRGTGGAGAQGILQGMIAGQQSRESDQKMQWLKTNQDRQTEQYETNESNERLYNMRDVKNNGGNVAPLIDSYNKWRKETTNYSDGDDFRMGNWDDHRTEGGGINQATANQWESDTGFEFGEKTTENNPIMLGDKFFNFETFSAGAPKFQAYANDRDLTRRAQMAKIKKDIGGDGPSDLDMYTELKDNKNRNPKQQTQYEVLQKKLKMTEDANIDKLTGEFGKTLEKAQNGEDVSQDVQNYALSAQAKAKQKFAKREEHATAVAGSKRMVETYRDLSKLTNKYDTKDGISKGAEAEILKTMSADDFSKLEQDEQIAVTANAIKQTQVFSKVFQIIKEQSGAAFTDEEFARRLATVVGGDPSKINEQTLMTAFGTYTAETLKNTKAGLGEISNLYMGDKLALTDSYNKGTRGFKAPTPESSVTPGGGMTAGEGIKEVTSSESQGLVKLAGDVATGFKEAVFGKDNKPAPKPQTGKDVKFDGKSTGLQRRKAYANVLREFEDEKLYSNAEVKQWFKDHKEDMTTKEQTTYIKKFSSRGDK